MTALRILYVINSMEGGGAASPLPAILGELREAGAKVRLVALTRRNGKALAPIEAAGFPVIVRDGGEKDHLAALRWLIGEAREFSATHLWSSLTRATLLSQIAGRRLRLPVVSWQHNAFLKPWNERLLRWNAQASALWIADSHEVASLTRQRLGISDERLVTWPIFFADPDAPQARCWRPGECLRIGSLGRLHPAKGYDILIEALAMLRREGFVPPFPTRIEIAGEGGERERLLALARGAGIDNLQLVGFTPDPRAFLASLHLYLQPSRREGFCIAAHEAMQAGLPVIVSATGEMPHSLVDGQMGRVVPSQDARALAEALRDLLLRAESLAEMGASGRARVLNRFSKERFALQAKRIVERMRAMEPG